MNRTLTFVLACISLPAWSASPNAFEATPLSKHIHTLSNAFACEVTAGMPGARKSPKCRNGNNPALTNSRGLDKTADRKTLRECMKPDNLIDEDVRTCMKGI
ncbi:hypothetical protein [Pseudomonas viridiflava]|uniref:Uncharacterized protein n=1 Tax=Pseudomonas viridiflava TaxID=33069 RepID=A0A1Y6JMI7_PSEVI|nr:hypothetical protein [Pseudomonas viridiflava]VVO26085.1 hypothetical protein PS689_04625 [Pseudomonas fluorescens]MBV1810069.1 hypothetical protein [Pseudomonas viridiflava]MEE4075031.1 hypothetical protein [Pseudomonas viridiflava]MEE4084280.1 hypothetical protein [Pseudomonas viridiflava]MEE4129699.1 hypothetical protein [Pseudomonas viridiflava]